MRQPEEIILGKPLYYATAMTLDGAAVGLLVETHLGRPTKIEGNPDHPTSRGATVRLHQASILELIRSRSLANGSATGPGPTGPTPRRAIREIIEQQRGRTRGGPAIAHRDRSSRRELREQIETLLRQLPEARWHLYEPCGIATRPIKRPAVGVGGAGPCRATISLGAERILSLDADFLVSGPGHLRYAADFMARRRARSGLRAEVGPAQPAAG